jgi:hypothetical protein
MTRDIRDRLFDGQVFSLLPVNIEGRVQSHVSPGWICGGQIGTRTGFLQVLPLYLVRTFPLMLHIYSLHVTDAILSPKLIASLNNVLQM